jgi:hypothetical protein
VAELFSTGRIVDLILGLMAIEGLIFLAWWRLTGRGLAPGALTTNLASGACLLMALRGALTGAGWGWIALCLTAALLAHFADLRRRWVG